MNVFTDLIGEFFDQVEAIEAHPTKRFPSGRSRWEAREDIDPLIRTLILMRDNHHCRRCRSRPERLQLDHIRPWSNYGSDRSWNLQTLCDVCNNKRSNRLETAYPRPIPVVAVCDPCLTHHRELAGWHEETGLWRYCPACQDEDIWYGNDNEHFSVYCPSCETGSWASHWKRIL